jgi:hypothetical protein
MAALLKSLNQMERPPRKSATSMRGYAELWACPHVDVSERQHEIMTKRPSLFAAKATLAAPVDAEQPEALPEIATTKKPSAKAKARPPSREGKRVLSVYLTPEAWKQLRMLSLNLESSTQSLGEEAVNLLFEKHRLNRIA